MAGVPQLRVEVGGVDPVNIGLRSTTKEVSVVSSKGDGGDIAHDLALVEQLHVLNRNPSQLALTSAHDQIPIGKDPNR